MLQPENLEINVTSGKHQNLQLVMFPSDRNLTGASFPSSHFEGFQLLLAIYEAYQRKVHVVSYCLLFVHAVSASGACASETSISQARDLSPELKIKKLIHHSRSFPLDL